MDIPCGETLVECIQPTIVNGYQMVRRDGDVQLLTAGKKGAVELWPRYSDLREVKRGEPTPTFCQAFVKATM